MKPKRAGWPQSRAIPLSCGAFGQRVPFSFVTFLLGKQKKSKGYDGIR
jgi:hypothetical protein